MSVRTHRAPPNGDLDDPARIHDMVRTFYQAVAQDDLLGPVFNDVAGVHWGDHIEKLTAFWSRILLGIPGFEGNALSAHRRTDAVAPFTPAHFRRWLDLFSETVDLGWAGPLADHAKEFAGRVAAAHQARLG